VRLADSVEIARPPEEVYAYLADPSNLPAWQGAVAEVRWRGGAAAQGDRFEEERTFIGKRATSTVEVRAAEPGREFSVAVVAGPVRVSARHLLEAAGEGTALRVEVEAESVPRLVAGMAARAARRQTGQDLARLKNILEQA
jgi:uncharacterized protein YndB with AHSA1/START domain